MKFSEKVWSDHGTTWLHFGSIRVNGSAGQRSICLWSKLLPVELDISFALAWWQHVLSMAADKSNKSVSFARWQHGAWFVVPRTTACLTYATCQVRQISQIHRPRSIDYQSWSNEIVGYSELATKLWMQHRPIPRNFAKKVRTLVRCTDTFLGNGLHFNLSALCWWQCRVSKLFSLCWTIVASKYVFSRRKAEKLRSAVVDVAGTTHHH